jgi:hypothetical protein
MKTAFDFDQAIMPALCVLLIPLRSFSDQRIQRCELI